MLTDDLVTKKFILELFKISAPTLQDWIKKGKFPKPFKLDRRVYWKKSEIEECLEKSRLK